MLTRILVVFSFALFGIHLWQENYSAASGWFAAGCANMALLQ